MMNVVEIVVNDAIVVFAASLATMETFYSLSNPFRKVTDNE